LSEAGYPQPRLDLSAADHANPKPMKFVERSNLSDPDAAARKLVEIVNAVEAVQDGRIYIENINGPFLFQLKGTPAEYKAGLDRAIANGWLWLHESGTYVKFTEAGAAMFA
jgi:hypothetical protein